MYWFLITISVKLLISCTTLQSEQLEKQSLTYFTLEVTPSWLAPSLTLSRDPVTSPRNSTVRATILPTIVPKQSNRTLFKMKGKKELASTIVSWIYKTRILPEDQIMRMFRKFWLKCIINFLTWRTMKGIKKTYKKKVSLKKDAIV